MKTVVLPASLLVKMRRKAEEVCAMFNNRVGVYGHNEVERTVKAWFSEYAVRQCYREGGIDAHQNIKDLKAPDLTIPAHTTLGESSGTRQEEVKCWTTGYSWNEYGGTITEYHATQYALKERARVWFCEVDLVSLTVVIHGWSTPAEILEADTRITSSGRNHQVEVMHRISEVMGWIEEDKDGWF